MNLRLLRTRSCDYVAGMTVAACAMERSFSSPIAAMLS